MLDGIRVLDLSDESGYLAGKILGDMGADVIKLEPPSGDRGRRGPYLGDVEDPERSLCWLALNTSKRGITLDLEDSAGQQLFRRLAATADVVLETQRPGAFEEVGIGYESLRESIPRLVWCAITPYGQSGPYADYRGSDLSVVAMGGNAHGTGYADRPPVRCTMPSGYYHGAPEAALGVAMALYAREDTGRGQLVDVSLQEAQLQTMLSVPGQYALDPERLGLRERPGERMGASQEIWSAQDGFVSYGLRGGPSRIPNLRATVAWMDECDLCPDWLRAYDWSEYNHNLLDAEGFRPFEEAFGAFFASKTMRELFDEAVKRRVFLAPCNNAREIFEHPQLRNRELFVTLEYPELGASIEHPGFFGKASRDGIRIRRRAPRIGEHNKEIYSELGVDDAEFARLGEVSII